MIETPQSSTMIFGEVAAFGAASGPAFVCACAAPILVPRRTIREDQVPNEMARFDAAVSEAAQDLLDLQQGVERQVGNHAAAIFAAHGMILHDTTFRSEIATVCLTEKANVEVAVDKVIDRLTSRFDGMESPHFRARHHSYMAALREIGIDPQPTWLVSDLPGEIAGGREGVRQLKQRGALPTATLCENDWLALGAMQELQRQGVRIPEDISLVGHDDVWICEQLEPKLTSVHRAEDELVAKAIDLLLEEMRAPAAPPREILVQGELVWRQSAGPAPERRRAVARERALPAESATV